MADFTRGSAFDLLTMVLERHRTLEDALDALPAQQSRDRAAAHRLAASVLRRLGTLDAVLEPFLRKEPPEPVRNILRIGAAGLLLLDAPRHAAVATAVALAKARGLTPFAGLVNAVLRKVATSGVAALQDLDSPRLDTPPWLWASWGDEARAIATAHQMEAPLDLTLNPKASGFRHETALAREGTTSSGPANPAELTEFPDWTAAADRLAPLSGRHSGRHDPGLRRRCIVGAGRRRGTARRPAGATHGGACR